MMLSARIIWIKVGLMVVRQVLRFLSHGVPQSVALASQVVVVLVAIVVLSAGNDHGTAWPPRRQAVDSPLVA